MITLDAPVTRPAVSRRRLRDFSADVPHRLVTVVLEDGYIDGSGNFVRVGVVRRTFSDETVPSFADFIAACPAAGNLRRQVETYETTLDLPGTVD